MTFIKAKPPFKGRTVTETRITLPGEGQTGLLQSLQFFTATSPAFAQTKPRKAPKSSPRGEGTSFSQ